MVSDIVPVGVAPRKPENVNLSLRHIVFFDELQVERFPVSGVVLVNLYLGGSLVADIGNHNRELRRCRIVENVFGIVEIDGPSVDTAYVLPKELFSCAHVKLWSQDGAAGDTNQGAARSIVIELKS